jgi:hypothetical protein
VPLGEAGVAALGISVEDTAGLAAFARQAVHYYLADRDSGRTSWSYPRFALGAGAVDTPEVRVPLEVAEETWESFSAEAAGQGVTPELLLRHALLYFSADVDAGRVARRLADDDSAERAS